MDFPGKIIKVQYRNFKLMYKYQVFTWKCHTLKKHIFTEKVLSRKTGIFLEKSYIINNQVFLEKLLKQVSKHVEQVQQVFTWKVLQTTIRFLLKSHTLKNNFILQEKS